MYDRPRIAGFCYEEVKRDKTEGSQIAGILINFSKLNDLYGVTKIELYGGDNIDIEGFTKDEVEVKYHLHRGRAIALGVIKEIKE